MVQKRVMGLVPLAVVMALGLAAIVTVVKLEQHADASRQAEVTLAHAKIELWQVGIAAWHANAAGGGSSAEAYREITLGKRDVERTVDQLRHESQISALNRIERPLQSFGEVTLKIYGIGSTRGYGPWINGLMGTQNSRTAAVVALLDAAGHEYAASAKQANTLGLVGSSAAIVLLLLAFALVYRQAARARAVAERLAARNRADAVTDTLTELRNRRALIEDLERGAETASPERPLMLALFDLDGFKQYNDTFGHAAGDALLGRLARALTSACQGHATAYRMGGDEFCVLARTNGDAAQELILAAKTALSETGDHWTIGCSAGVLWLPTEASSASEALSLVDIRMYAEKAGRASAGRQATDALLRVLNARDPDMKLHTSNVARHARAAAQALGLRDYEISEITVAAELHDIGKTAIPDAVLAKPGALDPAEWELIRQHTLLGERIMHGAPALANAARLVRSSHERIDGTGYPDGLTGEQIPLGSRIICVCDAFDAMISERPYKRAISDQDALAELRRCAGTQFDSRVVEVFCTKIEADAAGDAIAA